MALLRNPQNSIVSVDKRVVALCCVFGKAHWGLIVGFILILYSVVCTVEALSLLYRFLYLDLYLLGDDALTS